MTAEAAAEYLAKLLSRPVTSHTVLRLSSAQRARFGGWLNSHGMGDGGASLGSEFTLNSLFSGTPPAGNLVRIEDVRTRPKDDALPELGVDIQSISELMANIKDGDLKANPEMVNLFTLREISYAQSRPNTAETLTGVFAAKEAIRKCRRGPALSPEEFRNIEVLPDTDGQPKASGYQISISHSSDFAVAVALRMPPAPVVPCQPSMQVPKVSGGSSWLYFGLLINALLMGMLLVVLVLILFRYQVLNLGALPTHPDPGAQRIAAAPIKRLFIALPGVLMR